MAARVISYVPALHAIVVPHNSQTGDPLDRSWISTMCLANSARRRRQLTPIRNVDDRQLDGECRPLALSRALDADCSAVELDEMARDRKTQPKARLRARGDGRRLSKAVEDAWQECSRNTDAGIGDDDLCGRRHAAKDDRYTSPRRGVLHRVRYEIGDDLTAAIGVTANESNRRIDPQPKLDAFAVSRQTESLDGCLDFLGKIDASDVEHQLPGDNA